MATVPAFAGIGAVVFLGEPFSWLLVLGLLLTCGGAWLGSKG
jgi:drug/metabolite transporter (DMT)-like permease